MKLRQPLSNQKGANSFRQEISKAYKMRERFSGSHQGSRFSYGICAAGFIWRSNGRQSRV
jgi:hypothetical protein